MDEDFKRKQMIYEQDSDKFVYDSIISKHPKVARYYELNSKLNKINGLDIALENNRYEEFQKISDELEKLSSDEDLKLQKQNCNKEIRDCYCDFPFWCGIGVGLLAMTFGAYYLKLRSEK